jgi:GT2 family glycosyltransferase
MSKQLGIIVPVKDQLFFTRQFLDSVERSDFDQKLYDTEIVIIVIDNGSEKETADFLLEWSLIANPIYHHKLIINFDNLGFSKAVNQGLRHIKEIGGGDAIVTNNDVEFTSNCITELYNAAHLFCKSDVGIVGGKLLFPDGIVQHAGAFLNVYGWGQHKFAGIKSTDAIFNTLTNLSEEEYVTGALFLIAHALLDVLPEFDEIFSPAYFEEVNYCYEARRLGYKTILNLKAVAYHYENVTGKEIYGNSENIKKELSDKNQIKFYKKRSDELYSYQFTSPLRLLISCEIYGQWSFSMVMRNLAKGLKQSGVDVSIASQEYHDVSNMDDWEIKEMLNKPNDYWNRVVLRSSEGDNMYLMPPGLKRIAHTTGESTKLHSEWTHQLNNVDQVLTTSTFFKQVLIDSGVKTQIDVLPNAIDQRFFNENISLLPTQGKRGFNFISDFFFGERKAPNILVKAFAQEFSEEEDVTLTLHSPSMPHNLFQQKMTCEQWVNNLCNGKSHAPILYTSGYFHDAVFPSILKNYDVMVLTTRGEGFGLPIVEAGALGIPSIVTNYSGVTDFLTYGGGFPLDYKLVDIPLQILPYFKNYIGGQWAEPNIDHLQYLMRYAFEHPDEVKANGVLSKESARNYSPHEIGKIAKNLIFGGL